MHNPQTVQVLEKGRKILLRAGSVHRKSISVANKTQRAQQGHGKIQETGSKSQGDKCARKNAARPAMQGEDKLAKREMGAHRPCTEREVGITGRR